MFENDFLQDGLNFLDEGRETHLLRPNFRESNEKLQGQNVMPQGRNGRMLVNPHMMTRLMMNQLMIVNPNDICEDPFFSGHVNWNYTNVFVKPEKEGEEEMNYFSPQGNKLNEMIYGNVQGNEKFSPPQGNENYFSTQRNKLNENYFSPQGNKLNEKMYGNVQGNEKYFSPQGNVVGNPQGNEKYFSPQGNKLNEKMYGIKDQEEVVKDVIVTEGINDSLNENEGEESEEENSKRKREDEDEDEPNGYKLPASKSPIMEAMSYCAIRKWGIEIEECIDETDDSEPRVVFRVTDFEKYYNYSTQICSKQNPTEDIGSRVKSLRRWFTNFPKKKDRKDNIPFSLEVRHDVAKKVHDMVEKYRHMVNVKKRRRTK